MSISGMTSFDSFLAPNLADTLESPSTSISEENWLCNVACSLPIAAKRLLAIVFDGGYVSAMTWAKISEVRRLRIEEMDRRARRENRASNNVTARSRSAKSALITGDSS